MEQVQTGTCGCRRRVVPTPLADVARARVPRLVVESEDRHRRLTEHVTHMRPVITATGPVRGPATEGAGSVMNLMSQTYGQGGPALARAWDAVSG